MATNFNFEEGPFLEDTTPMEWELIRKFSEDHPDQYEQVLEDYFDDPSYTEYILIKKAKECYG